MTWAVKATGTRGHAGLFGDLIETRPRFDGDVVGRDGIGGVGAEPVEPTRSPHRHTCLWVEAQKFCWAFL